MVFQICSKIVLVPNLKMHSHLSTNIIWINLPGCDMVRFFPCPFFLSCPVFRVRFWARLFGRKTDTFLRPLLFRSQITYTTVFFVSVFVPDFSTKKTDTHFRPVFFRSQITPPSIFLPCPFCGRKVGLFNGHDFSGKRTWNRTRKKTWPCHTGVRE